jgi:hypothetical protein
MRFFRPSSLEGFREGFTTMGNIVRVTLEVVVDIEMNTDDNVPHRTLDNIGNTMVDAVDLETEDLYDNFNVVDKKVQFIAVEQGR